MSFGVGQKVCSGFSIRRYEKTLINFLANPILSNKVLSRGLATSQKLREPINELAENALNAGHLSLYQILKYS